MLPRAGRPRLSKRNQQTERSIKVGHREGRELSPANLYSAKSPKDGAVLGRRLRIMASPQQTEERERGEGASGWWDRRRYEKDEEKAKKTKMVGKRMREKWEPSPSSDLSRCGLSREVVGGSGIFVI